MGTKRQISTTSKVTAMFIRLLVIGIFICGAIGPVRAQEMKIVANFFGCQDTQTFMQIFDNDMEAFNKAKEIATSNGKCTNFSEGEPVFVIGWSMPEFVKIRRKGDLSEYWTVSTLVK